MSFILEDRVEDPAVRTAIEEAREGGCYLLQLRGTRFAKAWDFRRGTPRFQR
jgi:hypothetical protein